MGGAVPVLIMSLTVLLAVSVSSGAIPAITGLAMLVGWVLGMAIVALGIKAYENLVWWRADRRWKQKKKEAKKKEAKEMKAKERERKELEDKIAEIIRRAKMTIEIKATRHELAICGEPQNDANM